jgi:hypothetical protein
MTFDAKSVALGAAIATIIVGLALTGTNRSLAIKYRDLEVQMGHAGTLIATLAQPEPPHGPVAGP